MVVNLNDTNPVQIDKIMNPMLHWHHLHNFQQLSETDFHLCLEKKGAIWGTINLSRYTGLSLEFWVGHICYIAEYPKTSHQHEFCPHVPVVAN